MTKAFLTALMIGTALPAAADIATTYAFDGSFDDATFSLESAIVGRGLVIDWVSHSGEMLNRTAADVRIIFSKQTNDVHPTPIESQIKQTNARATHILKG